MALDPLDRDHLIASIQAALEAAPYAHAMWQGGAAAFGRIDEWSDIDLLVDVDDEYTQEAFQAIEASLAAIAPIDLQYEVPQPTWHGHAQKFYRLQGASPFCFLDIALIRHTNPNKFLEKDVHGSPRVYFDKSGVVQPVLLEPQDLEKKLAARVSELRTIFQLFQVLTLKELQRGNDIEALQFYQGYTLRPLVELLRIRYQPARRSFFTRYIHYDLPAGVVRRLEELFFVSRAEDLRQKRALAEAWFYDILEQSGFPQVLPPEEKTDGSQAGGPGR